MLKNRICSRPLIGLSEQLCKRLLENTSKSMNYFHFLHSSQNDQNIAHFNGTTQSWLSAACLAHKDWRLGLTALGVFNTF